MKYFSWLASIKTTVFCLLWLTVLTFWGTMYQAEHGLYRAQEMFFDSFVFLGFEIFPLPGAMLVMTVLFVNLLASFFVHYQAGWKMPGLMLIHIGLIMLLLGGFFTKITGMEANVSLVEGQGRNLAASLTEWEVLVADELQNVREIKAVELDDLKKGTEFAFDESGLRFRVLEVFDNAKGIEGESGEGVESPSGFRVLKPLPRRKQPEEDLPGLRVAVEGAANLEEAILWGNDRRPVGLETPEGHVRFLAMRKRRYELPMFIELKDFQRTLYPGSEIPKDYRSLITVHLGDEVERDVVIKMNEPFRLNGWTFYQQSFAIQDNTELSVFAVTRNFGRLIPYWATGITSLGLAMHFLQMQLMQLRRRKRKSA